MFYKDMDGKKFEIITDPQTRSYEYKLEPRYEGRKDSCGNIDFSFYHLTENKYRVVFSISIKNDGRWLGTTLMKEMLDTIKNVEVTKNIEVAYIIGWLSNSDNEINAARGKSNWDISLPFYAKLPAVLAEHYTPAKTILNVDFHYRLCDKQIGEMTTKDVLKSENHDGYVIFSLIPNAHQYYKYNHTSTIPNHF